MLCGMITKHRHIEYLTSTPINYTCYNWPEHVEDANHVVVGNFLKRNRITARQAWGLANALKMPFYLCPLGRPP